MQEKKPRSLAYAFARRSHATFIRVAIFVLIACAVSQMMLTRALHQSHVLEIAKLCGAAIEPGSGGDLSDSVQRISRRFPELFAVGELDSFGHLNSVHPNGPAMRRVVMASDLGTSDELITVTDSMTGQTYTGAVVPLEHDDSPYARKALILLDLPISMQSAYWATAMLTLALLVAVWVMVLGWQRWFNRGIVTALRGLCESINDPTTQATEEVWNTCGKWIETVRIARRFEDSLNNWAERGARAETRARETEHRLQESQRGFERKIELVKEQVYFDALTKLRNRNFLNEMLEPLTHKQRDAKLDLSLVMIDVDNFKTYNDAHGHQVGDALLRFVGAVLRGSLRDEDHAVRYGGDEFLLILPNTNQQSAHEVATRMVKLFGQHAKRVDSSHQLSLSAGVASLRLTGAATGVVLLARADQALYVAKHKGKACVAVACPLGIETNQVTSAPASTA